jgi:nucleotide-binding universal stress UspA family protein
MISSSTRVYPAADLAFSLAEAMWSRVLVFAVIRPPEPPARVELNAVLEEAREHYEQNFVGLREQAKLKGVDFVGIAIEELKPSYMRGCGPVPEYDRRAQWCRP